MKDKTLAADLKLPVFDVPLFDHSPSKMSWAEAMRCFGPLREQYMRDFDSPEKRLRDKNPVRFSLASGIVTFDHKKHTDFFSA